MKADELKELIQNISRWKRGDLRAPHKPLLLVYVLSQYFRGHTQLFSYENEIDKPLVDLLKRFGPVRSTYNSTYPFWRLLNDKFWKLTNAQSVIPRRSNTDPPKSELIKHNVEGGFSDSAYDLVKCNKQLVNDLIYKILDDCFPESISEQILDYIGHERPNFNKTRDPKFRTDVLRAYSYRCAVCQLDIRVDSISICLEAAHIRWKQYGGPCSINNGLCLCSLHHRAFDMGAISIDEDYRIILSSSINGGPLVDELFYNFDGVHIYKPKDILFLPSASYIKWHRDEVFRQ
jgi:putative restriction endonuclease